MTPTKQDDALAALEALDRLMYALNQHRIERGMQLYSNDENVHYLAIKKALTSGAGGEWQPIESAPRDGRMFLVMFPRMMNLVVRSRYNTLYKHFTHELDNDQAVTKPAYYHEGDLWCDIPPPPKDGKK